MSDIATDLIGKRVTVRRYVKGVARLEGDWENYSGIVRAVSAKHAPEDGMSFHLLIETVSSDRKGSRRGPLRLFVADVAHDEVHVVATDDALPRECGATDNIGSVCKLAYGHPLPHGIGHAITWERDCRVEWTCPAASMECLIRQKCTNKCGKNDPKP